MILSAVPHIVGLRKMPRPQRKTYYLDIDPVLSTLYGRKIRYDLHNLLCTRLEYSAEWNERVLNVECAAVHISSTTCRAHL